jgi:large subunit ribosomal protein L13
MTKIVIDATNATLGRLASYAAKQSLLGKEVIIINCNNAVIAGKSSSIISEYQEKRAKGGSSQKGPFFPKSPERIVKRTIRGMLPYKKAQGLAALKRVICHNSIPPEYQDSKKILAGKEKKTKTLPIKELSQLI